MSSNRYVFEPNRLDVIPNKILYDDPFLTTKMIAISTKIACFQNSMRNNNYMTMLI